MTTSWSHNRLYVRQNRCFICGFCRLSSCRRGVRRSTIDSTGHVQMDVNATGTREDHLALPTAKLLRQSRSVLCATDLKSRVVYVCHFTAISLCARRGLLAGGWPLGSAPVPETRTGLCPVKFRESASPCLLSRESSPTAETWSERACIA